MGCGEESSEAELSGIVAYCLKRGEEVARMAVRQKERTSEDKKRIRDHTNMQAPSHSTPNINAKYYSQPPTFPSHALPRLLNTGRHFQKINL